MRAVIEGRLQGRTQQDIANELGLVDSRVCQIEAAAVEVLHYRITKGFA